MVAIFAGNGTGLQSGSGATLGGTGLLGSANLGRANEKMFFNAANGNFVVTHQDEFLAGRGPDLGISRTHNSQATWDGDNGDNWQQSTTRRVHGLTGTVNTSGSTIKRTASDGSDVNYVWKGSYYETTDGDGAHDRLTYSGGVWTWTDGASQYTEKYVAYGADNWRITEHSDLDGNKLTFTYSGADLTRVTTANNEHTDYVWSGGNIAEVTTSAGGSTLTRVRYSYDGYNRLVQVTTDLSPTDNSVTDGKVYQTNYTYHGTTNRIASISQTDGSNITIAYDGSGRVTSFTQTAASGVSRLTSIVYGSGYTDVTDPTGQTTRMYYDSAEQLTQIRLPAAQRGAAQQHLYFTYDSAGNVTSVSDAEGGVTSYTYDANGNVTKVTDANGNTSERWYDAGNRLTRERTYGANEASANVAGYSRYAYDSEGHLRYAIDQAGRVTEYRYAATGELQHEFGYPEHVYNSSSSIPTEAQMDSWRDGLANRSSAKVKLYQYDARNNLSRIVDYRNATVAGGASNSEGFTSQYFTYDQAGNLIERHGYGQQSATFVYDGMNRRIASTDLAGGTTTIVFNDAATTTTVTTSDGGATTKTYNKAGELISQTQTGAYSVSGTSTYKYDKNGQLRMSTDATGNKSYYLYDKVGRKVADIYHNGQVTEYRYDDAGRVIASASYANTVSAANLTTLANPDNTLQIANIRPSNHADDIWSWNIYDAGGRLIETIDGEGGVATFAYDKSDRLVKTTSYYNKLSVGALNGYKTTPPTTTVLPTANAANDAVTRTFYDGAGHVIGTLNGEGYLTENVYDAAGQKISTIAYAKITNPSYRASGTFNWLKTGLATSRDLTSHYVYDGGGLRYSVDADNQVISYTYDHAGQQTGMVVHAAPIASTSDYSFDNVKSLVNAVANNANDHKSWNIYNGRGQRTYAIDAAGGVTAYKYDSMGRVVKATGFFTARTSTGLTTDATMTTWAAANTHAKDRITRNYFSGQGELRFTVDAEGYKTRYDYDAEGRQTAVHRYATKITVSDATTIAQVNSAAAGTYVSEAISYDNEGRVSTVTDGEGNVTKRVYDATGSLRSEYAAYGTSDQVETRYAYDNAGRQIQLSRAYGTTEQADVGYAYDGFGNMVSMTDAEGHVTSYTHDRLGRVHTETNALSGVVTYQYDAFGNAVKVTDARGNASYNYYDDQNRLFLTIDAEGYATRTEYSAFDQIASVTRYYSKATGTGNVSVVPTTPTNAKDATTSFEYDKLGQVIKTTDAEGFYEQYTLDAFGNRTSISAKSNTATKTAGGVTTYAYDRRGLLVSETLPMASYVGSGALQASTVTNSFTYDARGNRKSMVEASNIAALKRTTIYDYDAADRLTKTTHDQIQVVADNLATISDKNPVEEIAYDKRGNVIQTIDANGAKTFFYYDALNRKVAQVDALGYLTEYDHDDNGNVTSTKIFEGAVTLPSTPGGTPPAGSGSFRETTFAYDDINRLVTTSIGGVTTGAFGASYAVTTGTITTTNYYDANGNVIRQVDGNGNSTYSYYDKMGRKTSQVDAEKYLTTWAYDGEGNVLTERRYATQAGSVSTSAPPSVAINAKDRVTTFTYDKNGNRLTETRADVSAYSINTTTGVITALTGTADDAKIQYEYNGLGQVTKKTEATGDYIDYVYDQTGRLKSALTSGFADYTGATGVKQRTENLYDGLNNLIRSAVNRDGGNVSDSHITTYVYSKGRLTQMTDAAGNVRNYAYDAKGQLKKESYTRSTSTGTVEDAIAYRYDLLGQTVFQSVATKGSSSWTFSDQSNMAYNAFGQLSQRGVNGKWIESYAYDAAGRLWKSNKGDGVTRIFAHDGNGNQTLAITSDGTDLTNKTQSQAIALLTNNGSNTVGAAYVAGVNATISVYDKRDQVVEEREPQRQLAKNGAKQLLRVQRSYNAFGDMVSETDALINTTNYSYNNLGRLVEKKAPTVWVTAENGAKTQVRPTEHYYYDISGRLIGMDDANGNRTTRALLSGTGYDGTEALVTAQYNPDGGVVATGYDVFWNARELTDGVGRVTRQDFDKMGNVVHIWNVDGQRDDEYAYDGLGQRISHTVQQLSPGSGYTTYVDTTEYTDYDVQGRVVRTEDYAGHVTATAYVWDGSIETTGMATAGDAYGGWTQTTTYENGKILTERYDAFGRLVDKIDMGGHNFDYAYDVAGRLSQRTNSEGEEIEYNYLNSGYVSEITSHKTTYFTFYGNTYDTLTDETTAYKYYATGRKRSESVIQTYSFNGGTPTISTIHDAEVVYDATGRMKSYVDAGTATLPAVTIYYEYDAYGNVRRNHAHYQSFNDDGTINTNFADQDFWFRYDAMNRVVTNNGMLSGTSGASGTTIVRRPSAYQNFNQENNDSSVDIAYNAAGERVAVMRDRYDFYRYGYYGVIPRWREERENYIYNADGMMNEVQLSLGASNSDPNLPLDPAPGSGTKIAEFEYDRLGRTIYQMDYALTTNPHYERAANYNYDGTVRQDTSIQYRGGDTYKSVSNYGYGTGTTYALGNVVRIDSKNYKNGSDNGAKDTRTTNGYAWWDGALQATIAYKPHTSEGKTYNTTYGYNSSGHLETVRIQDGSPRTITYLTDVHGTIYAREETGGKSSVDDPHTLYHRFDGRQLGMVTNNGTDNVSYRKGISDRYRTSSNDFRFGGGADIDYADFNGSYDAINGFRQSSSSGGTYTVKSGDTMQAIAAAVWGDANLWYKIAEANGITGNGQLIAGQSIRLPSNVLRTSNTADTFKAYDPAQAIGDTMPTRAAPPKKKDGGCGAFGAILIAVVAVAVTVVTAGAALSAAGVGGGTLMGGISAFVGGTAGTLATVGAGVLGGAVGSIVSQGVGLATGIQDKFSWKGVALSGLAGGIGGGIAGEGLFGNIGSNLLKGAARGALSSAITQGVATATGLQDKFSWAGVAAAGVGGGVGAWASSKLGATSVFGPNGMSAGNLAKYAAGGMAGSIAGAATRSAITGTSFGDNVMRGLPDAIGNTIGNAIAGAVAGAGKAPTATAGPGGGYGAWGSNGNGSGLLDDLGGGNYHKWAFKDGESNSLAGQSYSLGASRGGVYALTKFALGHAQDAYEAITLITKDVEVQTWNPNAEIVVTGSKTLQAMLRLADTSNSMMSSVTSSYVPRAERRGKTTGVIRSVPILATVSQTRDPLRQEPMRSAFFDYDEADIARAIEQGGKIEYAGNTASAIFGMGFSGSWGEFRNLDTGTHGKYYTVGGGVGLGIGVTRDYGKAKSLRLLTGYGESLEGGLSAFLVGGSYSITQTVDRETVAQGGSLGVGHPALGVTVNAKAGQTYIYDVHYHEKD